MNCRHGDFQTKFRKIQIGFARVKCEDCGHEYLLAFACKRRHFCPSCHQKRVVEVGDIRRFDKVGNYSSYCRCVESKKISNGKKKGKNNQKNGNRYLAWAYVEAANHAIRSCPKAQKFFQRKMAKSERVLSTKAFANKLTKATYYIMRDQVTFDEDKLSQ